MCAFTEEVESLLRDNRAVILENIADELRARLPPDAMLPSETYTCNKVRVEPGHTSSTCQTPPGPTAPSVKETVTGEFLNV